jgi:hypothetical protein
LKCATRQEIADLGLEGSEGDALDDGARTRSFVLGLEQVHAERDCYRVRGQVRCLSPCFLVGSHVLFAFFLDFWCCSRFVVLLDLATIAASTTILEGPSGTTDIPKRRQIHDAETSICGTCARHKALYVLCPATGVETLDLSKVQILVFPLNRAGLQSHVRVQNMHLATAGCEY